MCPARAGTVDAIRRTTRASTARRSVSPAAGGTGRRLLDPEKERAGGNTRAPRWSGQRVHDERESSISSVHFRPPAKSSHLLPATTCCYGCTVPLLALLGRRTHQLIRRPNVARHLDSLFATSSAGDIDRQTDTTCRSPTLTMSPVRSEKFVAAREVRARAKIRHTVYRGASFLSKSRLCFVADVTLLRRRQPVVAKQAFESASHFDVEFFATVSRKCVVAATVEIRMGRSLL